MELILPLANLFMQVALFCALCYLAWQRREINKRQENLLRFIKEWESQKENVGQEE